MLSYKENPCEVQTVVSQTRKWNIRVQILLRVPYPSKRVNSQDPRLWGTVVKDICFVFDAVSISLEVIKISI